MIIGGITLPNPEWNDSRNQIGVLTSHMMMDGGRYTHVLDPANKNISISISNVDWLTAKSLADYISLHSDETIAITNWVGTSQNIKVVTLMSTLTSEGRGVECLSVDELDNERYKIDLEYEVV